MQSLPTNKQEIPSEFWYKGWTLDFHTTSSVKLPDGTYDTTRSPLGESIYKLKYQGDRSQIEPIAATVSKFLLLLENNWWFKYVSAIIPIPPSKLDRPFQSVWELAGSIARQSNIEYCDDYLIKTKPTVESKNIDVFEKKHQFQGAFGIKDDRYKSKTVLVFDDLYDTGTTMQSACKVIKEEGQARYIYALAATKTRTQG